MENKFEIFGNHETREVWINGKKLNPAKSQAVRNHSPDGFSWGYGGSGPMQLGLAIMLEVFPDDATSLYREFTRNVIARIPTEKSFKATMIVGEDADGMPTFEISDEQKN